MRKLLVASVAAATMIVGSAVAYACADEGDARLPDDRERHAQLNKTFKEGVKSGSAWNMIAVSHHDIGGRGNNADVYVHKNIAYVGHWVTNSCPASGVALINVTDPMHPHEDAVLPSDRGTWAEDVVVYTAQSGSVRGRDIAVASNQVCGDRYDRATKRGITLWDVTDPHHPVELGRYDAGCCSRGVHEFEVAYRADLKKTYAFVAVPFAELDDVATPNGVRDLAGKGEFRIIDITNPASPVEVAEWGARKRIGLNPTAGGQGCYPYNFGHSTEPSDDGKTVYVSYWDAGFMAFDVTNPASPRLISTAKVGPREDVDAHSSSYDDARKLLFTGDEDFCKAGDHVEKGFGYMRVWDYGNPAAPKQIGSYRTPNASSTADPGAGDYTVHNPLVEGTDVYLSWYTDGIRVVDASNPSAPREVANFVPPASHTTDPPANRNVLTNTTQVWGVAYDKATGLVYGSDMNSGLWVLARTDR